MSGGQPGGCHGSTVGGGALSEILAERLGKGWSGRVFSVNTLRGELVLGGSREDSTGASCTGL